MYTYLLNLCTDNHIIIQNKVQLLKKNLIPPNTEFYYYIYIFIYLFIYVHIYNVFQSNFSGVNCKYFSILSILSNCFYCNAAPELLSQNPYGHSIDWWSLGIIAYAMLLGEVHLQNSICCKLLPIIHALLHISSINAVSIAILKS